jgi:alcohol dehydrogenase
MDISFKFDPEVLIGADTLSMAGTVSGRHGSRMMVAADHSMESQTVNRLKEVLEDSGLEAIVFDGIEEDSNVEMAENIVQLTQAAHCDAIIAFGGRKTQTIARMAAIMAPMRLSAFDLLDGRMFQNKFLPLISIPVEGLDAFSLTDFFIAVDPRKRLIKSISSPAGLYTAVIIDSSLFTFLGGNDPAAFLFDGFIAALEAYCSTKANFLSDAILERALNFWARLFKGGAGGINADIFAQASFLTALGNSASSPAAGSALPFAINARFPVSKQMCSAVILPFITEKLASARPEKIARAASFLGNTGKAASVADAAAQAAGGIRRCMETFNVKSDLKEFNITMDRVTAALETARSLEFVANSPWIVSGEDIFDIFKQII